MRRNSDIGDSPKTVEALTGSLYTTRSKRGRDRTSQVWFTDEGEESKQRSSTKRVDTTMPACWNCSIRQVLNPSPVQRFWIVRLICSATSPKTPEGFDFTVCTPFGRDNTPCYINNLPCLQLFEHLNTLSKTMRSFFGSCSDQRLANAPLTTAPPFSAHVPPYEHPSRQGLVGSQGLVQQNAGVYADSAATPDTVQWTTCIAGFHKDDLVLENFASLTSARKLIHRYDEDADKSLGSALPSLELSKMLFSMIYLASNNLITDHEASTAFQLLQRADCLDLLTTFASSSFPATKAIARKFLPAAVKSGNIDMVGTFLSTGIDINFRFNNRFNSLLLIAVREGNLQMTRFLLGNEADAKKSPEILNAAVTTGNLQLVRLLYDSGARNETRNVWIANKTALQSAASKGQIDIVKFLLSRGADVNADAGRDGETVLQAAASTGI
jgi:hypothetical protein